MKKNILISLALILSVQVQAQTQILFSGIEESSGLPCTLTIEEQNKEYNMNTFTYSNSQNVLNFYNKPFNPNELKFNGLFEGAEYKSVIGAAIFPVGIYHQVDVAFENNQLILTDKKLLATVVTSVKLSEETIICK